MNFETMEPTSEDIRLLNLLKDIEGLDSVDTMGILLTAGQSGTTSSLASWIEREKPQKASTVMGAFNVLRGVRKLD